MGILSPQISQVAMKYSTELYSFFIVIFTVIFVELSKVSYGKSSRVKGKKSVDTL